MTPDDDGDEAVSWTVRARTTSAAQTRALAASLAALARKGDVVVLAGMLGAGKTTFAEGFASGLGVEGPVTSPTFTLVRQYPCALGQLLHADVYRLDHLVEVADLGLGELVEDGVALVEWGDVAVPALGPVTWTVSITPLDEGPEDVREMTVHAEGDDERRDAVASALGAVMLLGIETAAERVGVALADDEGVRAVVWVRGERRHAEALAPAIAHVLEQGQATLAELDAVAVDVGPGLFTGLRVGVATAEGLAQGLGVGVLGVTSLEVLAREAFDGGWQGQVAAIVDARRKEVFAAVYGPRAVEVEPPARRTPGELATSLRGVRDLLVVGTGAHRYPEVFSPLHVAAIAAPSPAALVSLAADRLAGGEKPVEPASLRPLYLREADARINWTQR